MATCLKHLPIVTKEITFFDPALKLSLQIIYKDNTLPDIWYCPPGGINFKNIEPGKVFSNDRQLLVGPSNESQYGLSSRSNPDDPAIISCLRSFWGGHLTLNGMISFNPKNSRKKTLPLTDYILFQWTTRDKEVSNRPLTPMESASVTNPPDIRAIIAIAPQTIANPVNLSLTIQENYSTQQCYIKYPDAQDGFYELKTDIAYEIKGKDPTQNSYGLENAYLIRHTQGDFERLITFSGTLTFLNENNNKESCALNNIIIHQWDPGEII